MRGFQGSKVRKEICTVVRVRLQDALYCIMYIILTKPQTLIKKQKLARIAALNVNISICIPQWFT